MHLDGRRAYYYSRTVADKPMGLDIYLLTSCALGVIVHRLLSVTLCYARLPVCTLFGNNDFHFLSFVFVSLGQRPEYVWSTISKTMSRSKYVPQKIQGRCAYLLAISDFDTAYRPNRHTGRLSESLGRHIHGTCFHVEWRNEPNSMTCNIENNVHQR